MLDNEVVIIDYEMGNLRSVQKAFDKIGVSAVVSSSRDVIRRAQKTVLPGVGSFSDGMKNLGKLDLISVLNEEVLKHKKPFLGICLGMQLVCRLGYEEKETPGLGWLDAEVTRFDCSMGDEPIKVPHVGWNTVNYQKEIILFNDIENNSDFYFVHSYYLQTDEDVVAGRTSHGNFFVSSIQKNNIYGCQFHPEKSQRVGLKLLENFSAI